MIAAIPESEKNDLKNGGTPRKLANNSLKRSHFCVSVPHLAVESGGGPHQLIDYWRLTSQKLGVFRPYIAFFDPKMDTINNRSLSKLTGIS